MESAVERAQREHKRAKITAGSARAKLKGLSQRIRKGAQKLAGTSRRGILTSGMSAFSHKSDSAQIMSPSAHATVEFQAEPSSFSSEGTSVDAVGIKEVDTSSNSFSVKE